MQEPAYNEITAVETQTGKVSQEWNIVNRPRAFEWSDPGSNWNTNRAFQSCTGQDILFKTYQILTAVSDSKFLRGNVIFYCT